MDPLTDSALPEPLEAPLPGDPLRVTIHRLRNGLTVYLVPDDRRPRITASLVVRAGARHEPEESTGLAHYLEHMMFKGSEALGTLDFEAERVHLDRIEVLYAELRQTESAAQRAEILRDIDRETQAAAAYSVPGEFDRLTAALGFVDVNAYTSLESTTYVADLPAARLSEWARLEAERLQHPVFRLFLPELEAVYEEKNTDLDSPEERLDRAMLRALFSGSPYGERDILGRVSHLEVPAFQDMIEFQRRWYVPNNMAVVLVGDVNVGPTLELLEETLGQLSPAPLAPTPAHVVSKLEGRVFRRVLADAPEAVQLAWRTVPAGHQDEAPLAVLEDLLSDPTAGALHLELELDDEVAATYGWRTTWRHAGYLGVGAIAHAGQPLDDVERRLLAVVDSIRGGQVDPEVVRAAVLNRRLLEQRRLEHPTGRAERVVEAYVEHRAWPDVVRWHEALAAVTADDVVRVANTYLGPDLVAAHRVRGDPDLPVIETPDITPVPVDPSRESELARHLREAAEPAMDPSWLAEGEDYRVDELPAGRLITALNPDNDQFALSYRFERGFRRAPRLCLALELFERSGTATMDPVALQQRIHALGGRFETRCDAEESWLALEGPDEHLETLVALVGAWLEAPVIPPDALDGLHDAVISTRHEQLERADWLMEALDDYARFGRQSAWLAQPSTRTVLRWSEAELVREVRRLPEHAHTTLYFGPRPLDEARDLIGLGHDHRPARTRPARRFRRVAGPRLFFVDADVAQAEIRVSIPLGRPRGASRADAALLGTMIGDDPTSALFQEVRESRGMAYEVWGRVSTGSRPADEWAFLGGMGTQADRTVDALSTYLEVLRAPADPRRLEAARGVLEGWMIGDWVMPRAVVYWIERWRLMGAQGDPRPADLARVRAVPADELEDLLTAIRDRPAIVAIVADRERVDMDALARLGRVTVLEPEDLYGYGPFPVEAATSGDDLE